MEAAPTPSTSKVILQCTDPSNLLETFESRLAPRTPLKNLHWKSPSRPLRSIPTLNISLERKDASQNGSGIAVRRHQIPGLRETPYVKLYLLRCDDKDTYKETARKEIKQWIKENTFEKESKSSLKNHEHHDAFEWMIVHVVMPGTVAASQPVSSKHLSLHDLESTDSVNSNNKSKWTGKSSSTIYDKLRADFSSSKLAIPRVAQVRVQEPGKPPGALPPSEVEEQWHDFVDNLKATILKSFDTRVEQYEEDIKERESQRSLPGWNFCTFFMLKEGLARGFENVGLLDDALAVYSELEIGLDTVVKEIADRGDGDAGGALLPYSNDLKTNIRHALDDEASETEVEGSGIRLEDLLASDPATLPFDVERRNYRDLILANQVSPFDVRIYIFTRQMEILLRRARTANAGGKDSSLDYNVMADFAELALNFINLSSRELRADMQAAWGGKISGEERALQKVVIGNAVASWSWRAAMQILGLLLPATNLDLHQFDRKVDILEEDARLDRTRSPATPNGHSPTSSASSSPRRGLRPESLSRAVSRSPAPPDEVAPKVAGLRKLGYDRLLATTARLFFLTRKTVENLPVVSPWVSALRDLDIPGYENASKQLHRLSSALSIPTLNGNNDHAPAPDTADQPQRPLQGLGVAALKTVASSQEHFHQLYSLLSQVMHHLYVEADNKHSARQVLIDLAMLAFSQGDRPFARQCLSTIVGANSHDPLVAAQPHVLAMYAECLKDEDRPNEYAKCLLACLRSSAARASPRLAQQQSIQLTEVAKATTDLRLPLSAVAEVVKVDRAISHRPGESGFTLSVRLRRTIPTLIGKFESAELKLRAIDQQDPQSLWLKCDDVPILEQSTTELTFSTSFSTEGWYAIEHLEVMLGRIRFEHSFQPEREAHLQPASKPALSQSSPPPIMAYLPADSVCIRAAQSQIIDLSERRSLSLSVTTGEHPLTQGALKIRPGTAGLRLVLHDAKLQGDGPESMKVIRENDTIVLQFSDVAPHSGLDISIPYTLDGPSEAAATVKCILDHTVDGQVCTLYQTCVVDVSLPIAVNVQDIYRDGYWYSHFLISPATPSPALVLGCEINENEEVEVSGSQDFETATTVFAQQPTHWLVRLQRKQPELKTCKPLTLNVQYQKLDEVAIGCLRDRFTSEARAAGFGAVANILSAHLVNTLTARWTEHDLELIGLLHEVQVPDEEQSRWEHVISALDSDTKKRLQDWFGEWHSKHKTLTLERMKAPTRELRLKVEIRPPPPVVTAELRPNLSAGRTTAALGQPLTCSLIITISNHKEEALQYSYELFAPTEAWLIGGRKKGIFLAGDTVEVAIVLFPQRAGLLMLPTIDIRCKRHDSSNPQAIEGGWVEVPIEVYNKTVSLAMQVTSNLHSATVGLMPDDAAHAGTGPGVNSGVLLQSQDRASLN